MGSTVALITIVSAIAIFILVGVIAGFITSKVIDIKKARRKKAHPQLWDWFDECDKLSIESVNWYNREIAPLKREIDRLLKDLDYLPREQRAKREEELERLRVRVHVAKTMNDTIDRKTQEVRDRIHKYVEDNNLEWARKWGW